MKKKLLFLLLILFWMACNPNSPRAVAEEFLERVSNGEFRSARSLGTESTIGFLNIAEALAKSTDSLPGEPVKYHIRRMEVGRDTAWCHYTWGEEEEVLRLVHVNGRWLVDIGKE